ncbi:hypothetical protein DAI22_10g114900 [Oryza sativa Japonica Group]|nr:hypothetical protein DAI22_10g114900 [Oryza sativa Japonica Group]
MHRDKQGWPAPAFLSASTSSSLSLPRETDAATGVARIHGDSSLPPTHPFRRLCCGRSLPFPSPSLCRRHVKGMWPLASQETMETHRPSYPLRLLRHGRAPPFPSPLLHHRRFFLRRRWLEDLRGEGDAPLVLVGIFKEAY